MTITINGHVLVHETSQNLRVETWDASFHLSQPVASTFTDAQGAFKLHLDEAYLQGHFSQQQPELYFKVFRGDKLLEDTQHSLTWHAGDEQREMVIDMGNSVTPTPQPSVRPPDLKRVALAPVLPCSEPSL
jgi:hypothetical protein